MKGHRQSCDPCLQMMGFKIPYSRVKEDITLLYPPKQNSETRGGDLYPAPRLWGWNVAKMSQMCISSILLWVALQIPCSLLANSCAPLPRPDSEIKKRAPIPRLAVLTVWLSCPNCCAPSSPFLQLQMCII